MQNISDWIKSSLIKVRQVRAVALCSKAGKGVFFLPPHRTVVMGARFVSNLGTGAKELGKDAVLPWCAEGVRAAQGCFGWRHTARRSTHEVGLDHSHWAGQARDEMWDGRRGVPDMHQDAESCFLLIHSYTLQLLGPFYFILFL